MRFSRSTRLLMFFSLETLTSIIRTGLPILVELIDLVNYVIIFLSQMTLLRWLTFLLGSQTVVLIVLLFWVYLFLLMLVFVLQWLSPIGKFWSCCFSFHWLSIKFTMGCPISLHSLLLFLCWLAIVDRLAIVAKGFLKLPNLHMLIKQKNLLLLRNLAFNTFGELLIVFSTKVNLL